MHLCLSAYFPKQLDLYKFALLPLFMTIWVPLSLVAAVFCACGSTALMLWRLDSTPIAERGSQACAGALWAVVWLAAKLTDGRSLSLFFFLSGYLVPLTHKLPVFLSLSLLTPPPHPPLPSQIMPFPLVNRGRKSRVEDMSESQKNMSLCGCGMLLVGCKYAVEEAFKTASHKWTPLSTTVPNLFLVCCLLADSQSDLGVELDLYLNSVKDAGPLLCFIKK